MLRNRQHTSPSMLVRGLLLTAALVLISAPAWAYIVVLEDGTQITTDKKYERQGDHVILTMPNGNEVSYPAADIDFEKTDSINEGVNLSNARVVEGGRTQQLDRNQPIETGEKTFAELVAERSGGGLALPQAQSRPADSGDSQEAIVESLPTTPAGFVDFMNLPRDPYAASEISSEIMRYLRGQGNEDVRVYSGTTESRPMVEILAGSEASVFKALRDSANCLVQLKERFPQLAGFDLLLVTDNQVRAGQFSLDPAQASQLATGQIEPPAFFLRYTEF